MAEQALDFAARLIRALDLETRDDYGTVRDLNARIQSKWREGVDHWGDLGLTPECFARHLAKWLKTEGSATERIESADSVEAYIVSAVIESRRGAYQHFEREYFARARAALHKMNLPASEADDVLQLVRVKLMVTTGETPCKLEQYAGGGDLRALIRVVATRTALDLLRKERRNVPWTNDELESLPAADSDPALAAARSECRAHFTPAFSTALTHLTKRERNLLRLHIVDGVSLQALARAYGVNKTTIVRWLVKARQSLLNLVCQELAGRSGIDGSEAAELARAIRSRVDLSLTRLLHTAVPD